MSRTACLLMLSLALPVFAAAPDDEGLPLTAERVVEFDTDEATWVSLDVSPDGQVNIQDLLLVIASWGGPGPEGDVDGDGAVDVADLLLIISSWGLCF